MFEKIKSGINKSVATVNVTSSVYLETSKCRVMIENNENSIRELTMRLGEVTYRQWLQGQKDQAAIEAIAVEIRDKKQEIIALEARIREVESEKQIILNGASKESGEGRCPQCGTPCLPDALFCGTCGFKIREEEIDITS